MIDRNESLRDQIATIVQAGYSQRKTSVETADEIRSKISLLSIVTQLERENAELREVLIRARQWGVFSENFSAEQSRIISEWIDAGMKGKIPPLPDYYPKAREAKP
jgi:hypothetical protein